MEALGAAALLWIGCHIGIAGTRLRGVIVRRIGGGGFQAAFSVLSVVTITLLVMAYRGAPYDGLWIAPAGLRWLLVAVMLLAFLLFSAAILARNPTAVGGDAALRQEPRGIVRVTRHPMLWSFSIWACVHVLGNGDAASLLFFGAFLVTSLAGMPSIDAKVAARDPDGWRRFSAVTSIIPFGAIAAGRNRFRAGEIGMVPLALGAGLWAVLLWAHPHLFGVPAVPIR
jgi:uncharacterized membrane protein